MVSEIIPNGTLVRVVPNSATEPYVSIIAAVDGYLWMVLSYDSKWAEYLCRSLATGVEVTFLQKELETLEQADGADT